MGIYESMNEIEGYLREGSPEQRINAICSLDIKKENYELFLEIFISDTDALVRQNALSRACQSDPKEMWTLLDYILKEETHNLIFIRIIAIHLLEEHKRKSR